MFLSVARPQANRQVEAINKAIKHNFKMRLEDLKGRWAYELPKVLWAYRTTTRTTTRETLFSLAYGYEVVVPMDIGAGSLRRENYDSEQNSILQRCELEFLKEKQCNSQLRIVTYQWLTARYFNSKVRPRRFQVRDCVLRNVLHNK